MQFFFGPFWHESSFFVTLHRIGSVACLSFPLFRNFFLILCSLLLKPRTIIIILKSPYRKAFRKGNSGVQRNNFTLVAECNQNGFLVHLQEQNSVMLWSMDPLCVAFLWYYDNSNIKNRYASMGRVLHVSSAIQNNKHL